MTDATIDPAVEAIITEAKDDFDLRATLSGSNRRSGVVTVYTDEETGDLLGTPGKKEVRVEVLNIVATPAIEGTGVLGEIQELDWAIEAAKTDDEVKELESQRAALLKKKESLLEALAATSLTYHFRSQPPLLVKKAKREAKSEVKINGKLENATQDLRDEYDARFTAHLLTHVTTSWTHHASGRSFSELSLQNAIALNELLPPSEYNRLIDKLNEVQLKAVVDESVTAEASF